MASCKRAISCPAEAVDAPFGALFIKPLCPLPLAAALVLVRAAAALTLQARACARTAAKARFSCGSKAREIALRRASRSKSHAAMQRRSVVEEARSASLSDAADADPGEWKSVRSSWLVRSATSVPPAVLDSSLVRCRRAPVEEDDAETSGRCARGAPRELPLRPPSLRARTGVTLRAAACCFSHLRLPPRSIFTASCRSAEPRPA
mmetsp:Transcript_2112/g.4906  ORF Transcript_2112/g.4906 Transcript_2112/m.4906 type:complete len:206 (+) Transcript_2112:380-997(+)